MKYKLSSLKIKLNKLGVFGIKVLQAINNDYTNTIDLEASQRIKGTEIVHKVYALTLEECLKILISRAEMAVGMVSIDSEQYEVPDISKRNMVGHINDNNFELVGDVNERV